MAFGNSCEIKSRIRVKSWVLGGEINGTLNIAFWERSEKPPRSDVLPKMAEALGVAVEDLLIVGNEKPLKKKTAKTNGRPAGKVREVFDRVSKLPRRQQEHQRQSYLLVPGIT